MRDCHSSKEYIEFLQLLNSKYPKEDKIRLVLDNLYVHTQRKRENIWLLFHEDLSSYSLRNMVHGSISLDKVRK